MTRPEITLYQFASGFGLPNLSPFCMKVETYLRMAGLPFRTVNNTNPGTAPKKKLPYIKVGDRLVARGGLVLLQILGLDFSGPRGRDTQSQRRGGQRTG